MSPLLRRCCRLAAGLVLALPLLAGAEVVNAGADGFVARNTASIAAPPARVWAALVEPARWWNNLATRGNTGAASLFVMLSEFLRTRALADMEQRRTINAFVEARKESFGSAADLYAETAQFLIDNGIGEATDVLLIDETLCVGCDNCEKACADSHEGLSRLDREAGRSYANLHVPTSCRHCEHPHCMADCPPNAIKRGPDGEVFIDPTCIGCGNCQRNCPYGVIRMDAKPPEKPGLLTWLLLGIGPGPGEASYSWRKKTAAKQGLPQAKLAVKCRS